MSDTQSDTHFTPSISNNIYGIYSLPFLKLLLNWLIETTSANDKKRPAPTTKNNGRHRPCQSFYSTPIIFLYPTSIGTNEQRKTHYQRRTPSVPRPKPAPPPSTHRRLLRPVVSAALSSPSRWDIVADSAWQGASVTIVVPRGHGAWRLLLYDIVAG